MGIRTGAAYRQSLADGRALYVNGDKVTDVTAFAPYRGIIDEMAAHYDRHHDPALAPVLTFPSPVDGAPVSNSFLQVRDWAHMEQRLAGERARAEFTYGLMGRLPDFMNAFVTDMLEVSAQLGGGAHDYAGNVQRYQAWCRDNDVCLTHTLVDPQIDRSRGVEAQQSLRRVRETDAGLVVSGARMLSTLAPVSQELLVGAFMPRNPGEEDYAVAFAVPLATPGLKVVCREPFDAGRSRFDRPLSGRFDEGDAIVIFDDVLVPWERVFCNGDLGAYGALVPAFLPGYLMLQAVIRGAAKLHFLTGIAIKVAAAVGRSEMPRYQELIGELLGFGELAEAAIEGTARQLFATLNPEAAAAQVPPATRAWQQGSNFTRPERGAAAFAAIRFLFPMANERAREIMQMMGSSGLIMTPTEADLAHPDLADLLPKYLRGRELDTRERVRIMKLAWDAMATEFGSRQSLYEMFFAGDPVFGRVLFSQMPRRYAAEGMVERLLAES